MHPNVNGGAELLRCQLGKVSTATAAGTGDDTAVNCDAVDVHGNYGFMKVALAYSAALTSTKTLSITAKVETSDVSNFATKSDFGTAMAKTAVAGGEDVTSAAGVLEFDFDLRGAKRYVRFVYTPDLSASGTDTATLCATYVLGGAAEQPITAKSN